MKDLLSHSASVSIIDRVAPPPSTLNESRIKFFQADITEVHELEKAVEETVQWSKEAGAPLGGVINCAGLAIAAKVRSDLIVC